MSATNSWIGEALQKFHLGENAIDDSKFEDYRMTLDHSSLPDRMYATCRAINAQAGHGIIYGEVFIRPHPVVHRYTLENDDSNVVMELAILLEGPGVVFSSNKTKSWVTSLQRYCGYFVEEKNNVVCKLVIDPTTVSDATIQRWFTYLLSGLHRSAKPRQTESHLNET
jgi:hypothetical protein